MKNNTLLQVDKQQNNLGEVVLYQPNEEIKLEVRVENESVWLNRQQLSILFGRDIKTIGKHITNAIKEELKGISVVAKFATTATDGKTYKVSYYNIDVILSVGYRVKSANGIRFRQWANKVLKNYLLQGYAFNQRFSSIENELNKQREILNNHQEKIDFFIRTALPPFEGIFYNGQIFDAYKFINDLIRSAKQQIILIDNYIDDSVLTIFDKRNSNVTAQIYTKGINSKLQLDIDKHNSQYPKIDVQEFTKSHDRFLIIDNDVYHIGASIKDLGKRWFAFCKMGIPATEIINNLN